MKTASILRIWIKILMPLAGVHAVRFAGALRERVATGFKLLEGQSNVIGVSGMAFFSTNRRSRPAAFPVVHGLSPADLPATRFQLFNNGFPILRHFQIEAASFW